MNAPSKIHFHLLENYYDSNLFMASFDVESLFTNIPLKETIDLCVDILFYDRTHIDGITKDYFRDLLTICMSESLVLFDGEFIILSMKLLSYFEKMLYIWKKNRKQFLFNFKAHKRDFLFSNLCYICRKSLLYSALSMYHYESGPIKSSG